MTDLLCNINLLRTQHAVTMHSSASGVYLFVEDVLVVGDVVAEQVGLSADDECVTVQSVSVRCVGGRRQSASGETANHLVDVEQTHIALTAQRLRTTLQHAAPTAARRPTTVWVVNEHLQTAPS